MLNLLLLLLPFWSSSTNIKAEKLSEAYTFCKQNKLDTTVCIMVDMSLPSGKNRLFVYDFKQKKTIIAGLCAHGVGGGSTSTKPVFSNTVGSNCTSLGKYKVKTGHTAIGVSISIIKCTDWKKQIAMHSKESSYCIRIHLYLTMRFIRKAYLDKVRAVLLLPTTK